MSSAMQIVAVLINAFFRFLFSNFPFLHSTRLATLRRAIDTKIWCACVYAMVLQAHKHNRHHALNIKNLHFYGI